MTLKVMSMQPLVNRAIGQRVEGVLWTMKFARAAAFNAMHATKLFATHTKNNRLMADNLLSAKVKQRSRMQRLAHSATGMG